MPATDTDLEKTIADAAKVLEGDDMREIGVAKSSVDSGDTRFEVNDTVGAGEKDRAWFERAMTRTLQAFAELKDSVAELHG